MELVKVHAGAGAGTEAGKRAASGAGEGTGKGAGAGGRVRAGVGTDERGRGEEATGEQRETDSGSHGTVAESSGGYRRLPTHVWHAKRFQMETMWGYRLAAQLPGRYGETRVPVPPCASCHKESVLPQQPLVGGNASLVDLCHYTYERCCRSSLSFSTEDLTSPTQRGEVCLPPQPPRRLILCPSISLCVLFLGCDGARTSPGRALRWRVRCDHNPEEGATEQCCNGSAPPPSSMMPRMPLPLSSQGFRYCTLPATPLAESAV